MNNSLKINAEKDGSFKSKDVSKSQRYQYQSFSLSDSILQLHQSIGNQAVGQLVQAKLRVNQPGDQYEQEADRIAEQVMRMPDSEVGSVSQVNKKIQRKCSCESGGTKPPASDITPLMREQVAPGKDISSNTPEIAPRVAHNINSLKGGGRPIPTDTRRFFESRFGVDFAGVRIHNSPQATKTAKQINASAYTIGHDIVFGAGQYSPKSITGKKLLTHELAHVVQQNNLRNNPNKAALSRFPTGEVAPLIQRSPEESNEEITGQTRSTDFRRITMHFNGSELVVYGDGKIIFRFSADSGRPVPVSKEDATACGADEVSNSYLNDKRFVGLKDRGPIPEGTYEFKPSRIRKYSREETAKLMKEARRRNKYTTIRGQRTHTGDWGAGRVALKRVGKLSEGPCGDANDRSDFFLHGGSYRGSSGCIDIGSDMDKLIEFLKGYRGEKIKVTVQYEDPATRVGFWTGLGGAFGYGGFRLAHRPRVRLGAEFSQGETRFLSSFAYEGILDWAGGGITAGVHLDISLNNRETFVRGGLAGGVQFRILRGLYGRLFAGANLEFAEEGIRPGLELGGGLSYDFGRVQLEALYSVLRPASEDERVHQALLGVGFRFGD